MVKFFKCMKCGNVVAKLNEIGCNPSCCGEAMKELKANTSDGAFEKHVPVVSKDGITIKVEIGSVAHPMIATHYIEWVYIETNKGGTFRFLKPEAAPVVTYSLDEGEELVGVYAYCNLHGLWAATL